MSFSVDIMKNRLLATAGISRPNRYMVYLTSPFGYSTQDLCLRCEATSLPGKSFATTPHTLMGSSREKPYNTLYETQELTFICSEGMNEEKFFNAWMGLIIDPYSGYVGYHDEYVTDLEIYQMGVDGMASYGVIFHEIYPKTVSPISLGYADDNAYNKLTVSFSYHKWTRVLDPSSKGSGIPNDIGNLNIPDINNQTNSVNSGSKVLDEIEGRIKETGSKLGDIADGIISYLKTSVTG